MDTVSDTFVIAKLIAGLQRTILLATMLFSSVLLQSQEESSAFKGVNTNRVMPSEPVGIADFNEDVNTSNNELIVSNNIRVVHVDSDIDISTAPCDVTYTGGTSLGALDTFGQSFTATCTGKLKTLAFAGYSGNNHSLTITVYSGEGTSNQLGQLTGQTISAGSPAATDFSKSTFDFSSQGIDIVSGNQYTFIVSGGAYQQYLSNSGGYSGGQGYLTNAFNSSYDFNFKVDIGSASNAVPTFTSLSSDVETTNEDTGVEITFAEIAAQGDEADADGTVVAFVVQAVSSGTLTIDGANYASGTNDEITSAKSAIWTPVASASGTLNAFTIKAKDNDGGESATAIQATVNVSGQAPEVSCNTTHDAGTSLFGLDSFGQSFTATCSGKLTILSVASWTSNNPSLTVTLYSGEGLSSQLAQLTNQTITNSGTSPYSKDFAATTFDFSSFNIDLVNGQQYTFLVSGSGHQQYASNSSTYAGGRGYYLGSFRDADFNFSVQVGTDGSNPSFTSGTAVNFAENGTGTAYTATATDNAPVNFSLGSGNDESLFNIVGGAVTFKNAPDFETPGDGNAQNDYVVNIIAKDANGNTANQNVTITVTDVNENTAPVFSSSAVTSVLTNQIYSYSPTATDADNDDLTFTATTKPTWLTLNSGTEGQVSTFAGSGSEGTADGTGTSAQFDRPYGLAVDGSNNLYVADYDNQLIRKITPEGVVSTLAGSGTQGYADGTGTQAKFNNPKGLAVDQSGNVYVAEFDNHMIRKITPSGVVTTLAGDNITRGTTDGTGTAAKFDHPSDLVIDGSGNLYVLDEWNNRIRKVTQAGVVSTFAGSSQGYADGTGTSAQFARPTGLAIDASGNFYVSDRINNRIRKISTAGVVTTLVGSGSAGYLDGIGTNAQFQYPQAIAVDATGNLYVTEAYSDDFNPSVGNHRVRKINTAGVVSTLAGQASSGYADGTGTSAQFNFLRGIVIDNAGNAYVADMNNHRIRKIALGGTVLTGDPSGQVGNHNVTLRVDDGNGGTAEQSFVVTVTAANAIPVFSSTAVNSVTEDQTYSYSPAATDADNDVLTFTALTKPSWLTLNNTPGNVVITIAGNSVSGSTDANGTQAQFNGPQDVAIDSQGNLFVSDLENYTIRNITPSGDVSVLAGGGKGQADGTGTSAAFRAVKGLVVDSQDNIYVADTDSNTIRKITQDGIVTTFVGTIGQSGTTDGTGTSARFKIPYGLAIDSNDNIFATDFQNPGVIRKITPAGVVTSYPTTGFGQPSLVLGITTDTAGDIYLSDTGNNKIVKMSAADGSTSDFVNLGFDAYDMAFDQQGNLFISDGANAIYVRNTAGTVSLLAGGTTGSTDGTGSSASFNKPIGLTTDSQGNLYIAETDGHNIRKIGAGSLKLEGNPSGQVGNHNVTLRVADGNGGTADQSFVVTVTHGNRAPVFSSTAVTSISDNQTYSYSPTATDADNDALTFTAPTKPSWLTLSTAPGGEVSTFAGSGSQGTTDGTGTSAQFDRPYGLAVDGSNNLYVADYDNQLIRKITPEGVVSTLAGSGTQGYADGTGTQAQFNNPKGLAVDQSGNVYVAEFDNHMVRKITPSGVVTTLAGDNITRGTTDGTGTAAKFDHPSDLVIDGSGNLYVLDEWNNRIRKVTQAGVVSTFAGSSQGYADGTGTSAQFARPTGLAVDGSGNFYVSDRSNNRIRKVTAAGVVTTLAGSGSAGYLDGTGTNAQFQYPWAIAVDATGNLYVTEAFSDQRNPSADNHRVRKINTSGVVSTLAGQSSSGYADGTGTSVQFNSLRGIVLDNAGNAYVADMNNHRIRKIALERTVLTGDPSGEVGNHNVTLRVDDGNGGTAEQSFVVTVVDSNTAPVVDLDGATVGFINENGSIGIADYATVTDADNDNIVSMTITVTGYTGTNTDQYLGINGATNTIATNAGVTVGAYDANTGVMSITGSATAAIYQSILRGIVYGNNSDTPPAGDVVIHIEVNDGTVKSSDVTNTITITPVNDDPGFTSQAVTSVNDNATYTYSISTSDAEGDNVTVTKSIEPSWLSLGQGDYTVSTFAGSSTQGTADGTGTTAQFDSPRGIAFDSNGNMYVADEYSNKIRKITTAGVVTTFAGSTNGDVDASGVSAKFYRPRGIALDGAGNLFVTDGVNDKIRKITPAGVVTTFAGTTRGDLDGTGVAARFYGPTGIVIDGSDNLYVADLNSHKIKKITPSGVVTTFAGTGTAGFADGPGSSAQFRSPNGITMDAAGNFYIADSGNNRVRKVTAAGVVSTIAGTTIGGNADGTGTAAQFNGPTAVAVDASGNIYVTDKDNHNIRRITSAGVVTTIAGSTVLGTFGFQDGTGTSTLFRHPGGLAFDTHGSLFVSDQSNRRIRKMTASGLVLSGDATGQTAGSQSVTLTASDGNSGTATQTFNINVVDVTNPSISSATAVNFAENGTGTAYTIAATDANAVTYALGTGNDEAKFNINGGIVTFKSAPDFENPTDAGTNNTYVINVIAKDAANNSANQDVTITVTDVNENVAPTFTSTPVTSVLENQTYTYELTGADNNNDFLTFAATTKPSWLSLVTEYEGEVTTFAGSGHGTQQDGTGTSATFASPKSVATDAAGNIYVAESGIGGTPLIRKVSPDGVVTTIAGGASGYVDGTGTSAGFIRPFGIAVDASNNIFVSDLGSTNANTIRKITQAGVVTTFAGSAGVSGNTDSYGTSASFTGPKGLAFDNSGNLFVADGYNIRKIAPDGLVSTLAGTGSAGSAEGTGTSASFNEPIDIAIDGSGNLYVSDYLNNKIRKITPTGIVSTFVGTGAQGADDGPGTSATFYFPFGLTFDNSGNLYVADWANEKIRKITAQGVVSTFAGSGTTGTQDGIGTSASFNYPDGIAFNIDNAIYVGDDGNHLLRRVSLGSTKLTGTPSSMQIGDHNVTLKVDDGNSGTAEQSFVLTVTDATPPVISTDIRPGLNPNANQVDITFSEGVFGGTGTGPVEASDFSLLLSNNTVVNTPVITSITNNSGQALAGGETVLRVNFGYTGTATGGESLTFTPVQNAIFDAAGNTASTQQTHGTLELHDETFPTITGVTLGEASGTHNSNLSYYIDVAFSEAVSGITLADFTLSFSSSQTAITHTATTTTGAALTGTETTVRLNLTFGTGQAEGNTINMVVANNTIFDRANNSVGATNLTTALKIDQVIPAIGFMQLDANNSVLTTFFNEKVFGDANATTPLQIDDLLIAVSGGTATGATITSLMNGGGALTGGEEQVNVNFTLTGTPNGNETVTLDAATSTSVFDEAGYNQDTPQGDNVNQVSINDIYGPVFTSQTTANFAENGTGTAYTIAATDAGAVTYSLGTGNDEGLFDINGGVVTFKAAPDFETPGDGTSDGSSNTYVINVIAKDAANNSVNQDVTITVTNVDDTDPVFTSLTTVNFAENGTGTAYTIAATDANPVTYALGTGNDEALFSINGGIVNFKNAPDFEAAADGNTDNAYVIEVQAHDGLNTAKQTVTITVTDIDEIDPVFTSPTAVNFAENGTGTAYTVAATDVNQITYALGAGNDDALFNINGGAVTFKNAPDFEAPADGNTDNAYMIEVQAHDGLNTAKQTVTITVTDIDEINPVFTSGTALNFAENGTGTAYTVAATDANLVTYALGTGNDEALFSINGGIVTFKNAPDFEAPADGNTDNAYMIEVQANDGLNTAKQTVTITVTDVDEIYPVFTSGTAVNFAENGAGIAYTVAATDANPVTYALGAGNDEALFDINGGVVTFKNAPDFEAAADGNTDNAYMIEVQAHDGLNTAKQTVTITVTDIDEIDPVFTSATAVNFAENGTGTAYTIVATDANQVTYALGAGNDEALFNINGGIVTFKNAPDFEAPADGNTDNAYMIEVQANDGLNTAKQTVTITVTDIDEIDPVFTSPTAVNFAENGTGTAYTVAATDANQVTYALGTGSDEALFNINGGIVTFKNAPDFEAPADGNTDNAYMIEVQANDGLNTAMQTVTITVTDIDETDPVFTSATAVNFAENGTGTAYTVVATDANQVTYALGTGNDEALFNINGGTVTFKNAPDFEAPADGNTDNAYMIEVQAHDGLNTAKQTVTITVTDIDEIDPVFTSPTAVNFTENGTGTAYTVAATDANPVTYALGTGNDEGLFNINGGTVTFKNAPDFEAPADGNTDNAYMIEVQAHDGLNTAKQTVTITVTDVDEINPVFTSGTALNFAENGTGTAYTVAATDANPLTYSLGTGNDEGLFNIDTNTGAVTFKNAPDFETPVDGNTDNVYSILVKASDGPNEVSQAVTITVTNLDDIAPVFSSPASISFAENGTGTAYTAAGTDVSAFVFGLGAGNDEGLFNIDPNTGAITFKTAPDFENPQDGNTDNAYIISIRATDIHTNSSSQLVTINVTDLDDVAPIITNLDPLDETTISANQTLRVTFDNLVFKGSGMIRIVKESNGDLVQQIDVNSAAVLIDGNAVSIDPPVDLPVGENLAVLFDGTTISDEAGNDITGVFNTSTWNHTVTGADLTAPKLIDLTPKDGSTVQPQVTITATFSENVFANQGRMRIYRKSDLLLLRERDIHSNDIVINGTKVSLQLPPGLALGEEVIIHFSPSSLTDASGNEMGSVFDDNTWNLTPQADNAPSIVTLSPTDGASANPGNNVTVTFNEPVAKGTGKVRLYKKSDLTLLDEVDITDPSITVNGSAVSFNLPGTLPLGQEIIVHFAGSALQDVGDNDISGLFNNDTWNLNIVADPAPVISSLSPVDGGSFVPGDVLTLTLNENVSKNSGKVRIYRSSDLTVLAEIDVTSSNVQVNGNVITVTTPANIPTSESIFVHFSPSTFLDGGANDLTGLFDAETWNLTTVADPAPTISVLSPTDGGNLNQGFNIAVTFSESVFKNSGKIRFYRSSDVSLISEMNINDSRVVINGAQVTITPPGNLPGNVEFFVHFSGGSLIDSRNNDITGVFTATTWNLTLLPDAAPTIVSLSPTDGSNVTPGSTATVTFSENVFKASGKVRIYKKSDLSLIRLIDINSPGVTVNGAAVSVQMPGNLPVGEEILIHFSPTSIEDSGGNDLSGVFTIDTWNLIPQADPSPTISSLSPVDGANTVQGATFTATFSEAIFKSNGKVRIYKKSDLSLLSTIDITSGTISVSGSTLSFDLPGTLPTGEELLIHLNKTALVDAGGNNIAGLFTVDTWNFTIPDPAPPTVNSDFTQLNKDILGLNEIVLTIYPNPTEGKFTIDLNEVTEVEQFVIYNTSGVAVIIETDRKQRRIEVDLTNESNGLYLINVQLKGKILRGKVLVRR